MTQRFGGAARRGLLAEAAAGGVTLRLTYCTDQSVRGFAVRRAAAVGSPVRAGAVGGVESGGFSVFGVELAARPSAGRFDAVSRSHGVVGFLCFELPAQVVGQKGTVSADVVTRPGWAGSLTGRPFTAASPDKHRPDLAARRRSAAWPGVPV